MGLRQISAEIDTIRLFSVVFDLFRSCTMWLDPSEATPQLQALQAALQEAFPKCDDLSTISDSFKPHLSVGQVGLRTARSFLLQNVTG
jgi:2'-5' RNA ligase